MDTGRWIRLLLVVLCVLPSVGAAESVHGHIEHHGATTLQGNVQMHTQASVFWREPTALEPWAVQMDLDNAVARLYNTPTHRITQPLSPEDSIANTYTTAPEQYEVWNQTTTTLTATSNGGAFRTFPLHPSAGTFELATTLVELSAPAPTPTMVEDSALGFADRIGGIRVRPIGTHAAITTPHWPTQELNGQFVTFVLADQLELDGKTVRTGTFLNHQKSIIDPVTGNGLYVYDNLVLAIEFQTAQIHVSQGPGWSLASTTMSGSVDGEATWRDVATAIEAGGQELPRDQHILTMQGTIGFNATLQGSRTVWDVEGTAATILVDTIPILDATIIGATTAGLLALLLLALTEPGRNLLATLIGRVTPRLVKAQPLGNSNRRKLMQIIHEHQPLRQKDLVARSGLAKTTVAYHLRVLLAHDILQTAWSGDQRGSAYMLNSGSLMFQSRALCEEHTDSEPEAGLRPGEVLAVVNGHPLRRDFFAAIQEHGPLDLPTLQRHMAHRHSPIPASTASRHLIHLEKIRAIHSQTKDRRKIYQANIDPAQARREQYLRYLEHHGLTTLVETLARDGPCAPQELAETLGAGPRIVFRSLRKLVGLGLVDQLPGNRYAVASVLPLPPGARSAHA